MPELPEVETMRRILEPQLSGRKILNIRISNEKIIAYPSAEEFMNRVREKTIVLMGRRGKFLTFQLEDGGYLVLHLRMTGQILVAPKEFPEEKHTHVVMELSGGQELRYIDTRRFGRFWYFAPEEEDTITGIHRLGVEPDSAELTFLYLKMKLNNRKKAIKEMLLEQSIVAGIGNIYSDEILFDAGICPQKKCNELEEEEWNKLAASIPKMIAWGIEADQMTPEEYLAGKGKEYSNISDLKVYGREKKSCKKCGAQIEHIVIGGRSSHYCPNCQH